ncbi:MAG: AAA family ATPase, partial [Dehalococcoidia bacterium]
EKATGGSGQVVGVVGEAGVGKSRILLEARKALPQGAYTYLEGRCLHHGGSMPYLPFLDMLRSYFDIKEGEREFIINKKIRERITRLDENLQDILSPLQEMLSLTVEDEQFLRLDRQYKRGKTFEAVRNLLIRESQNRPLVLAVEDLHWIDNASQELLTYLIGSLPSTAILLLLLYRPEYTHPWASKSNYSQIRVDQLSTGTSAELVQSILAEADVSTELRELVLARAGGNPFFVEEFIYSLLENGSIQRDNGNYILTAKPADIQVPDTVQGVISARMDRLDENLKRTMQVASVIGRDFAYSILETITGTQEELKSYLVDLQLLEFIYEKSLFPELEYIFKHALTQEVAYNSLLLKRRKKIHERIGEAIEILYPDRLEEFYEHLAFHYQKGESIDKAVDYLIKAGRKSFDRYALEEAHRFFIQAFEALLTKPERTRDDDLLLIDLVIEWAFVFYFRGDFRGLTDLLNANRELAESLDDRARYGMFLGWLGFTLFTRGYSKESYELLKKALELGEEIGDQRVIGYTCTWLTHTYLDLGLFDEAIAIGERAQEIFRSLEADHYIYFKSLIGIGQTYFMRGDAIKTYATGEALMDFGQRHTSIRSIVVGHVTMSWIYYMDGDFAAAAECCTRAIEVSADPFFTMVARMMLGICQVMNGQFQEGEDTLQEALSHMLTFGYEYLAPLTRFCMGFAAIARGQVSEALDTAEGTLRSLLEGGRKNHAVIIQANLGKVYMLLEGVVPFASQKAEEHVNATIELAREIGARKTMGEAYLDLGLLHSSKGENEQARECVSKSVQLFEQCGLENWLKQAREALEALG